MNCNNNLFLSEFRKNLKYMIKQYTYLLTNINMLSITYCSEQVGLKC